MLTREEYIEVAHIHREGISDGFLSSLGVSFLALLYESIDSSRGSVLRVSRSNGKIVGFVAGTQSLGEVYRLMLKSWFRLFVALLPSLFSPRKIFKIAETVVFSRKKDAGSEGSLPRSELLSISVRAEFRGKGIADQLFNDLVDYFRKQKIRQFKIVVGDALVPAHKFYRRMGACPVNRAEVHKGSGSVIYVRDVQ